VRTQRLVPMHGESDGDRVVDRANGWRDGELFVVRTRDGEIQRVTGEARWHVFFPIQIECRRPSLFCLFSLIVGRRFPLCLASNQEVPGLHECAEIFGTI
jgi:hypothetical protein